MKDRIDDLPFSQDWPDRTMSSTLQRGFNPGEPRNNHLPPIHPFATRSLLLLESSAVWPGINVCRSPFLASLSFSRANIFRSTDLSLFSHPTSFKQHQSSYCFYQRRMNRKTDAISYFSKSSRKLSFQIFFQLINFFIFYQITNYCELLEHLQKSISC